MKPQYILFMLTGLALASPVDHERRGAGEAQIEQRDHRDRNHNHRTVTVTKTRTKTRYVPKTTTKWVDKGYGHNTKTVTRTIEVSQLIRTVVSAAFARRMSIATTGC